MTAIIGRLAFLPARANPRIGAAATIFGLQSTRRFSVTASGQTDRRRLALRATGFALFCTGLGGATAWYVLATDPVALHSARVRWPRLLEVATSLFGLPPAYVPPTLDDEEEGLPADVSELVESELVVGVRLGPGRRGMILLSAGPLESTQAVGERALQTASAAVAPQSSGSASQLRVEEVIVVEQERVPELRGLGLLETEDALEPRVRLPEVPDVIARDTVALALELCDKIDVDLEVRRRLVSRDDERSAIRLDRAVKDLARRRSEIESLARNAFISGFDSQSMLQRWWHRLTGSSS